MFEMTTYRCLYSFCGRSAISVSSLQLQPLLLTHLYHLKAIWSFVRPVVPYSARRVSSSVHVCACVTSEVVVGRSVGVQLTRTRMCRSRSSSLIVGLFRSARQSSRRRNVTDPLSPSSPIGAAVATVPDLQRGPSTVPPRRSVSIATAVAVVDTSAPRPSPTASVAVSGIADPYDQVRQDVAVVKMQLIRLQRILLRDLYLDSPVMAFFRSSRANGTRMVSRMYGF
ncbi:unnamed protein product [Soboliphyme baturini]|uniref:Uncharacterized protein n=1 Tax=Soboliphyme baturini TaxID=241478 RepID=A0A183IVT3_9BILA|nr:unnamed protein product [Soboliphyme baturini]